MRIKNFDYNLPKELIAQYPSEKRELSRLLVLHRHKFDTECHCVPARVPPLPLKIEHRNFYNIVDYFGKGDVLILNETKVIPARLIGKRADTGGKVEVFLIKPVDSGELSSNWEVLISPHRARKVGVKVQFGEKFWGEVKSISTNPIFKFYCNVETLFYKYGQVPLPPYIKRPPEPSDYQKYQTVYARVPGACAAPTAGLHFTHSILDKLKEEGVEIAKIVLHTGLGTFKPIKCEEIEDHKMEPEYYEISGEAAHKINTAKRRIAVGTSTVRALESVADIHPHDIPLSHSELPSCHSEPVSESQRSAGVHSHQSRDTINRVQKSRNESPTPLIQPAKGWTNLFIYPPYKFKIVDALITNFHLPKSTPLLLVCAFADVGARCNPPLILKAYEEAINHRYRFYSYGDAMLII